MSGCVNFKLYLVSNHKVLSLAGAMAYSKPTPQSPLVYTCLAVTEHVWLYSQILSTFGLEVASGEKYFLFPPCLCFFFFFACFFSLPGDSEKEKGSRDTF